jgi:hypothetical protein
LMQLHQITAKTQKLCENKWGSFLL